MVNMVTFTTVIGVGGTLIASGIGELVLRYKGKEDLAETLKFITSASAYGYGLYWAFQVVQKAAILFL